MANFDYPAGAPGADFHNWDAVSRRRFNVSGAASRHDPNYPDAWGSDWQGGTAAPAASAPAAPAPAAPAGGGYGNVNYGSTGDSRLDLLRNNAMADAAARISGARLTARNSAGNDPSQAATAGLDALIGGQSQAQHDLNSGALTLEEQQRRHEQEIEMLHLQYALAEQQMREANKGSWLGDLGQIGGTLAGTFLGGPAGGAVGAKVGSALGKAGY